ncbi:MAG: serine/threonine protein kinase [Myxococcales bacterium]|nr:serine/threonine protein kinase [Myxococcales bacterium]
MARPYLEQAQARVGTTARKWTLDRLIDVGGMAAVYGGTHRNGNQVAIKVLHKNYAEMPEAKERFLREGYVANKVGHSGVPRVLDDDETEDGRAYLVMELLDGESLEKRHHRRGNVMQDEMLQVADQALGVLAAAHEKGIVHRDLKPENLFLTHRGEVKVLDFGIARFHETAVQGTGATRIGDLMGTLEFMSPEQARAQWDQVDAQSDLWSLGATLYNILTGECPHKAKTVEQMMIVASSQRAPALATVLPRAHPRVCAVIDGALEFAKRDRFKSALEMQEAVREAYRELTGVPIHGPLPLLVAEEDAETMMMPRIAPEEVRSRLAPGDVPASGPPSSQRPGPSDAPPSGMPASLPPPVPIPPSVPPPPIHTTVAMGRPPGAEPPLPSGFPPAPALAPPGENPPRQTWIKRALAEPGHAKRALWMVRLGVAVVVAMLVGAVVWAVTQSQAETPSDVTSPRGSGDVPESDATKAALPDEVTPASAPSEPAATASASAEEPDAGAPATSASASATLPAPPPGPLPTAPWPSAPPSESKERSQFLK